MAKVLWTIGRLVISGRRTTVRIPWDVPPDAVPLPPAPTQSLPTTKMPTTAETMRHLQRRLGQELYRVELDLQDGARIGGAKPCDCLTEAKHSGQLQAVAKELMSYEPRPVYGHIVDWVESHLPEFQPEEIAKREPDYYRSLVPEVRAFRKDVMGTEKIGALLSDEQKAHVHERVNTVLGERP